MKTLQKRIPKLSQTYLKSLSMSKGPIIFTRFGLKPTRCSGEAHKCSPGGT